MKEDKEREPEFLFGSPIGYNVLDGSVKFIKRTIYTTVHRKPDLYLTIHPPYESGCLFQVNDGPASCKFKLAHYKLRERNCEGVAIYDLVGNPFEEEK